jgi:hypothetical protein
MSTKFLEFEVVANFIITEKMYFITEVTEIGKSSMSKARSLLQTSELMIFFK